MASELLLQAKGRWQSDIGRIYARMTRRMNLAASGFMHKAKGRDLEELLPEFTRNPRSAPRARAGAGAGGARARQ